jgi:hypothetical protein
MAAGRLRSSVLGGVLPTLCIRAQRLRRDGELPLSPLTPDLERHHQLGCVVADRP